MVAMKSANVRNQPVGRIAPPCEKPLHGGGSRKNCEFIEENRQAEFCRIFRPRQHVSQSRRATAVSAVRFQAAATCCAPLFSWSRGLQRTAHRAVALNGSHGRQREVTLT